MRHKITLLTLLVCLPLISAKCDTDSESVTKTERNNYIYDVETLGLIGKVPDALPVDVSAGRQRSVSFENHEIHLRDLQTGASLASVTFRDKNYQPAFLEGAWINFSARGRYVLEGTDSGFNVRDAHDLNIIRSVDHDCPLFSFYPTNDREEFVAATGAKTTSVYSIATGRRILEEKGPAVFLPGGQVAFGDNGKISIWHVTETEATRAREIPLPANAELGDLVWLDESKAFACTIKSELVVVREDGTLQGTLKVPPSFKHGGWLVSSSKNSLRLLCDTKLLSVDLTTMSCTEGDLGHALIFPSIDRRSIILDEPLKSPFIQHEPVMSPTIQGEPVKKPPVQRKRPQRRPSRREQGDEL